MLVLRELDFQDQNALEAAIGEFRDPDFSFVFGYQIGETSFSDYVKRLEAGKHPETAPANFVPTTMLFGFVDDEIIGRVSFRHCLNKDLEEDGGHIGFGVVPRFRGQGFAVEMLTRTLTIAKEMGLDKVLLTCDEANMASRKTIERCNGKFERYAKAPNETSRRYWIKL